MIPISGSIARGFGRIDLIAHARPMSQHHTTKQRGGQQTSRQGKKGQRQQATDPVSLPPPPFLLPAPYTDGQEGADRGDGRLAGAPARHGEPGARQHPRYVGPSTNQPISSSVRVGCLTAGGIERSMEWNGSTHRSRSMDMGLASFDTCGMCVHNPPQCWRPAASSPSRCSVRVFCSFFSILHPPILQTHMRTA